MRLCCTAWRRSKRTERDPEEAGEDFGETRMPRSGDRAGRRTVRESLAWRAERGLASRKGAGKQLQHETDGKARRLTTSVHLSLATSASSTSGATASQPRAALAALVHVAARTPFLRNARHSCWWARVGSPSWGAALLGLLPAGGRLAAAWRAAGVSTSAAFSDVTRM